MEQKHQFIITRYCPREEIFRGEMTFTEARRFMSENATYERRVGFEVFNEAAGRWEKFNNVAYHGGRKVYENGDLYILDPDYRSMWKPEDQQWHLWCITPDGRKIFCQSFKTEGQAIKRCDFLQKGRDEYQYIVELSDINIQSKE